MWQHIHKLMEVPFFGLAAGKILEVGAGAGEHLPFVTQRFETYYQTDLDISLLGSTPPPTRRYRRCQKSSREPACPRVKRLPKL